jgi:hypothetical protein
MPVVWLLRSDCAPAEETETRTAPPLDSMSLTKTSANLLVSPGTRSVERESNAT